MKSPISSFIFYCKSFVESIPFLAIASTISFSLKLLLLIILIRKTLTFRPKKRPWAFLLIALTGAVISDFSWIVKLFSLLIAPKMSYQIVLFFIRVAWIFVVIQYHAFALFIESLVVKHYKLSWRHKILLGSSCLFAFSFVFITVFHINCASPADKPSMESILQQYVNFYGLFILTLPSLIITLRKICTTKLPLILRGQLRIFMAGLAIPYWICELIYGFPFIPYHKVLVTHSFAASGICTLLFTGMLYFCAKKIIGLRFLNFNGHVQLPIKPTFLNEFRSVLEQMSSITDLKELNHVTRIFFNDTLGVPIEKSHIFFRNFDHNYAHGKDDRAYSNRTEHTTESFLALDWPKNEFCLTENKILIYDEIEFSNFYEEKDSFVVPLKFLDSINADIFLPIRDKNSLIAYVIVERNARPGQLYSDSERDQMIIFAQYLSSLIKILKISSFESLIEKKHNLEHELYQKHQEINKYKEGLKSFLKDDRYRKIGVLFYKISSFQNEIS